MANISNEDRLCLMKIARSSISSLLNDGRASFQRPEGGNLLKRGGGAFVSLHKGKNLRGCIGVFSGNSMLYETVSSMAVAAASQDPRFKPLSQEDLDKITIEISLLSPMHKIADISEIMVGIHGIYITKGVHKGVLLPQVATEYGWDRERFLEHTCLKAGLQPDAWKDEETDIYIYSADVFREEPASIVT